MIVVDSSVWIAHLRNTNGTAVQQLRRLDDTQALLVGDLILLEVLQGARDERHAMLVEENLRAFTVVSMLDASLAVQAARNYRTLRARGITIRKTIDIIIGTFCLERGHTLLHEDRDFEPMAEHLGLLVM